MTSDDFYFIYKISPTSPPIVPTVNGSCMHMSHIGNISIPSLTISDAYIVHYLSLNLLSIGQLCNLGFELCFSNHYCDMQTRRDPASMPGRIIVSDPIRRKKSPRLGGRRREVEHSQIFPRARVSGKRWAFVQMHRHGVLRFVDRSVRDRNRPTPGYDHRSACQRALPSLRSL